MVRLKHSTLGDMNSRTGRGYCNVFLDSKLYSHSVFFRSIKILGTKKVILVSKCHGSASRTKGTWRFHLLPPVGVFWGIFHSCHRIYGIISQRLLCPHAWGITNILLEQFVSISANQWALKEELLWKWSTRSQQWEICSHLFQVFLKNVRIVKNVELPNKCIR